MADNDSYSLRQAEAAARACLVRYGRTRLLLSWLFEILLQPLLYFTNKGRRDTVQEPQSILVLEYWYLGDAVMLTPFLKNLRLHYPSARIAILANPRVIPILEGQGLANEIIPVNVPWVQNLSRWRKYCSQYWIEYFKCIVRLRARQFDLGFTVRADVRENFLLWVSHVKQRVGYGYGYGGSLLTDVVVPDLSRPHFSDRWLRLLEHLNKAILARKPELKLTLEQRGFAKKFLQEKGIADADLLIGFHPGARNEIRQWGNDKFAEVARRLRESFPVKVLWFRDPGSSEAPEMKGAIPVLLPTKEFLGVLAECAVLICNDTGPMHMASGLGVPVVAVFGPGMPDWWGPKSHNSQVVAHGGVWCRPCFDYCIFDQPYCLQAVTLDAVYEAAARTLGALRVEHAQQLAKGEKHYGIMSAPL